MKIIITTPSGNIGSKLADILLNSREAQVTVLARTPSKVEHFCQVKLGQATGDTRSSKSSCPKLLPD